MSSRQRRRYQNLLLSHQTPRQNDLENEDFEPLYVSTPTSTSYNLLRAAEVGAANDDLNDSFAELMVNSPEGSELGSEADEEITSGEPRNATLVKKKKTNNRKKKYDKKRSLDGPTTYDGDVDEVSRAVAEVNRLVGGEASAFTPQAANSALELSRRVNHQLLQVNHKNLDPERELTRRFGPVENAGPRNRRENNLRHFKRHIVVSENTRTLALNGLSMKSVGTEGRIKNFKLVHSPRYQGEVRELVANVREQLRSGDALRSPQTTDCIEAIIMNIDYFFMTEELTLANNMLEMVIHSIQSLFPPAFNYVDGVTRVEYKYVENRVFHILLLKFMYMTTNKACHVTSLEVAKLLLNLDPSDPLGVIFIIDTLALRARAFRWLVQLFKHWSETKDAGMLFHMKYSHALAWYNIYLTAKDPELLDEANKHLKDAIRHYPSVAFMLLQKCQKHSPAVENHNFFTALPSVFTPPELKGLQKLYVAFVYPKWRENDSINWLYDICKLVAKEYTDCPIKKAECDKLVSTHGMLFLRLPVQIKRHLYVIKFMSTLLVDGEVPNMQDTFNFNPYPEEESSIDEYRYFTVSNIDANGWQAFRNTLFPGNTD